MDPNTFCFNLNMEHQSFILYNNNYERDKCAVFCSYFCKTLALSVLDQKSHI